MKYGIVVCPKCKNPKVVLLSFKSSKCMRCGKILYIDKLKIFYKTSSKSKVRTAVGLINAERNKACTNFNKIINKENY
jgi:uncharacterized protein YbaR (Trm112 family)